MEIKKQTTTQQNVCALPLKIQLSTGEGRDPINRYNSPVYIRQKRRDLEQIATEGFLGSS